MDKPWAGFGIVGAAATSVVCGLASTEDAVKEDESRGTKDAGQRAGISEAERQERLAQLVQKRSMLSPDEAALLREVFPDIFEAHHDYVWDLLRKRGLEGQDVEDLLQEVFLTLHNYILAKGFVDSIPGMLHELVRGKVRNHVRARNCDPFSIGLPSSGSEKVSQLDVERALHYQDVARRIFSQLSREHQDVLDKVVMRGLTHIDAAEELGIPEGTLKSRLLAAKRAFLALAEPLLPPSQRGPV